MGERHRKAENPRQAERHQEAERQPEHPFSTNTPLTTNTVFTTPLDGRYAVGVASCEPSINRGFAVQKALTNYAQGPHTGHVVNFSSAPLFHRWEGKGHRHLLDRKCSPGYCGSDGSRPGAGVGAQPALASGRKGG